MVLPDWLYELLKKLGLVKDSATTKQADLKAQLRELVATRDKEFTELEKQEAEIALRSQIANPTPRQKSDLVLLKNQHIFTQQNIALLNTLFQQLTTLIAQGTQNVPAQQIKNLMSAVRTAIAQTEQNTMNKDLADDDISSRLNIRMKDSTLEDDSPATASTEPATVSETMQNSETPASENANTNL